jgi:ribosomal protein L11 methyltransferase
MPYLELSFDLQGQTAEAAEAACFQTGALSVTFCDAGDDPVLEPRPGELRLWRHTRMQALFDATLADALLIRRLADAIGVAPERLHARAVADRIWEREWLRDFHAMRFGERLWVAPRHESVTTSGAIVVQLDPGLAFGSGTHPTTAMCLQWLDAQGLDGCSVVDFGCGSGVLAIAALKLGARHAHAYDIDPQALLATRENAASNQVAERLTVCGHIDEIPPGRDVLLANILADTLIAQQCTLAALLRPDGRCLLSGILSSQESEVVSAFEQWSHMTRFAQREDWVTLSGQRHRTRLTRITQTAS